MSTDVLEVNFDAEAPATPLAHPWEQMVSTREVPWMKLGKLADNTMTAEEAIVAGGLDFTVSIRDNWYSGSDGKLVKTPSRKSIVRDDNDEHFEVVSDIYPILQYREAFDFADGISGEYVAAGKLKGGKQGFLVKKPDQHRLVVGGEDVHDLFFVIRTSHDRTRALEITLMPLRRQCMNQLTLASFSHGVKHRWSITHTTNMHTKLLQAEDALRHLGAYTEAFNDTARRLMDTQLDNDQAVWIMERVLADRPKRDDTIVHLFSLWKDAPTVGYAGTAWGLVNAVSDYYDWGRSHGTAESRFTAALQGQTHKVINKVAALALSRGNR